MRVAVLSLASAILLASVCVNDHALAYGVQRTHEELADAALRYANRGGKLDALLRDTFGLDRGIQSPLAIQFGLDATIDDELVTGEGPFGLETRLNRSLSRIDEDENGRSAAYPYAPHDIRVFFERSTCREAPGFDTCFAALTRADVLTLIMIGTYAEDNPNPRSKHHFHDPEREHAPPDGNHGLDESNALNAALNAPFVEIATAYGRGGDWLRARWAIERALALHGRTARG